MSLITQVRANFAYTKRIAPSAVVVVQYKGKTASCLRVGQNEETVQTPAGNKSVAAGSVKASGADLDRPIVGDIVKLDSVEVFVGNVTPDALGALFVIHYQTTKPYTGEAA